MTAAPGASWSASGGKSIVDRDSFSAPKRSLGQNFLADPNICRRIVAAAREMDIRVLDHLVVTEDRFFSFQAEGMI